MIGNAVYERTLSVVNAVNREMTRTTPDLNAVLAIARGSAGLAVNGLADTTQGLSAAISGLRSVQPTAEVTAAPVASPRAEPRAGEPNTPASTALVQPPGTISPEEARTLDSLASQQAASDAAALLTALSQQNRAQVALTQISACAFEHAEGGGTLAFSPQNPITLAPGQPGVVNVSGGRGPYRVTGTGPQVASIKVSAELTNGPIGITTTGAAEGQTASFLVEDVANRVVPPQTLTVVVARPK